MPASRWRRAMEIQTVTSRRRHQVSTSTRREMVVVVTVPAKRHRSQYTASTKPNHRAVERRYGSRVVLRRSVPLPITPMRIWSDETNGDTWHRGSLDRAISFSRARLCRSTKSRRGRSFSRRCLSDDRDQQRIVLGSARVSSRGADELEGPAGPKSGGKARTPDRFAEFDRSLTTGSPERFVGRTEPG